jgi:glucokinase
MTQKTKNIIIGVDVGGTKIQAGAIKPDGRIIGNPVTIDTGGADEKEKIFARISYSIESAILKNGLDKSEILGIGMGVTGPLDNSTGTILECPQLPTMHFFPLKDRIEEKFNLPVIMDNDANALLLGESIWGAGRAYRSTLGFTLGTGLGCAIVVDKKLFSGSNGLAGEIWPSPFNNGTIEDLVSGRGVSSIYKGLTNHMKTSKEISVLATEGDPDALKTWKVFGESLAVSIAWGINLLDPDIVILGGSIANSFDLFYEAMESVLRKYICPVPAVKTRVVKAGLGDNAGFIGSASLVMQNQESQQI